MNFPTGGFCSNPTELNNNLYFLSGQIASPGWAVTDVWFPDDDYELISFSITTRVPTLETTVVQVSSGGTTSGPELIHLDYLNESLITVSHNDYLKFKSLYFYKGNPYRFYHYGDAMSVSYLLRKVTTTETVKKCDLLDWIMGRC